MEDLQEEEEAGRSGQVGTVIITVAKAALMWETKQRCEWKHGGYQDLSSGATWKNEQQQNQLEQHGTQR